MSTPKENGCWEREALEALPKEKLIEVVLALQQSVAELQRRLGMNSQNSSKPPSSDPPWTPKPDASGGSSERKPGGQPGHPGHTRKLVPLEQVDRVEAFKPQRCAGCGASLEGDDPLPERRQVTELPPITVRVTEYQRHTLPCPCCGHSTPADWPEWLPAGAFGPRLVALVAMLTGGCRLSRRMTVQVLQSAFGVKLSLGTVGAAERSVSQALAEPMEQCRQYAKTRPVAHVDETGWFLKHKIAWLWVMATTKAAIFQITPGRGRPALRGVLGGFQGVLVSDRWGAYNDYCVGRRQLCWAHLIRAFRAFQDAPGDASRIGEGLLQAAEGLFDCWHRIRDGTISRATFQQQMEPVTAEIQALLEQGTHCGHASTQRNCKRILKLAPALWTFVTTEGVEPTNNAAERAVRPAVLWRKNSFGSHSDDGNRFVERVLTVTTTMKLQHRNPLEYLTQVYHAFIQGHPVPSPLPTGG